MVVRRLRAGATRLLQHAKAGTPGSMTSKRTKWQRLKASALERARAVASVDPRRDPPPAGAVLADHAALAHNNTYDLLPKFYVDRAIVCRQCGTAEVWPADRQKWWYEVAKGNINTHAVLCRSCRESRKSQKTEARRIHLEGVAKKRRKHVS